MSEARLQHINDNNNNNNNMSITCNCYKQYYIVDRSDIKSKQ